MPCARYARCASGRSYSRKSNETTPLSPANRAAVSSSSSLPAKKKSSNSKPNPDSPARSSLETVNFCSRWVVPLYMNYFAIVFVMAGVFMGLERILPGRDLPRTPHWFLRAMFFNAMQLLIIVLAGLTWSRWLDRINLVDLSGLPGIVQGFIAWFIGTFVFYWWHRARHSSDFLWNTLHQVHHSPARIETLTAFYKHPLEIVSDSILSSVILYVFVGASPAGAGWYYIFAAGAEFFYHSNLRTPAWIGTVMQRPE